MIALGWAVFFLLLGFALGAPMWIALTLKLHQREEAERLERRRRYGGAP